jgi:hypothetical protein
VIVLSPATSCSVAIFTDDTVALELLLVLDPDEDELLHAERASAAAVESATAISTLRRGADEFPDISLPSLDA